MLEPTTIALLSALFAGGPGVGIWLNRRPIVAPAIRPAAPSREERRSSVEAMVLRAGLEDTLCYLVEIYGVDYLDAFLERRIRRNVQPFRHRDHRGKASPHAAELWRQHAQDAESILTRTIDAVRRDPSPPA
jgi:hypothetical protein